MLGVLTVGVTDNDRRKQRHRVDGPSSTSVLASVRVRRNGGGGLVESIRRRD